MTSAGEPMDSARYPVWDHTVRLIHWYFPLAIGVMWWSGEQGRMEIHAWVGYSLLICVLTRIVWGVIGSEAARFNHFVRGPGEVQRYLKSGGHYAGHNPLGALSVLALLALLLSQTVSGTMSSDDILFEGPFAYWADDWSGVIGGWHETNWRLLQGFIALHLISIGWYQWKKRQPLVQTMIRGHSDTRFSFSAPKPLWLSLLTAAIFSGVLWWLMTVAPEAPSYY